MYLPGKKSEEAIADAKVTIILFLCLIIHACSPAGYHNFHDNLYFRHGDGHINATSIADDLNLTDTILYAWQEYNVSPLDTIWFNDFLVVGADTLSYHQAFNREYDYYAADNGYIGELFSSSSKLLKFHPGFFIDIYYYDPFYLEFYQESISDNFTVYYPRFISPGSVIIEDGLILTREGRPLYSYYMGRHVDLRGIDARRERVLNRQTGFNIQIPVISALLEMVNSK